MIDGAAPAHFSLCFMYSGTSESETLTVERQIYSMWYMFGLRLLEKHRKAKDFPMPGLAVKTPMPRVSFRKLSRAEFVFICHKNVLLVYDEIIITESRNKVMSMVKWSAKKDNRGQKYSGSKLQFLGWNVTGGRKNQRCVQNRR